MTVRTLITLALAIPAFWLALRFNMHMFQLNTYINGEQKEWLRRNSHLQWILKWAMCLGIVRMAAGFIPQDKANWLPILLDVIIWLTLAVIILVYRLMIEMNSKKPLVFTPRVKRMIVTIIIVSLIFIAAMYVAGTRAGASSGIAVLSGAFAFSVGFQLWAQMLAEFINRPIERNINNGYIKDAKRILAENPNLTIIGVTGSYGKTSVKFYLETLLKAKYSVLVTPESYNTPMGVVITIRKWLRPSHEIFICEMGARYEGEIKELCDLVHPSHGMITSIGPQHLDTFGSIENIQKTKFELADALPEGGMLFVNGDSEYAIEQFERGGYKGAILYHSEQEGEGYYASDIKVSNLGTEFTVNAPSGESARMSMKLVGAHYIINVMGAIAVAHKMGISLEELKIPVRRLQSVPHRMEMKDHGDVTIIDDAFNSNPIGSKAAVETLALFDGLKILITPGMVELGADEDEYNRKFGTYAADCCDWVLLVGKKPHTDPIREGLMSKGFDENRCLNFGVIEEALKYAYGIKTSEHKYILLENDLPDNY